MHDPVGRSATDLAADLRAGVLSVVESTTAHLDAVIATEDELRAWAHLDPELALAQARALDALPADRRGPLHGVPVGVKDIIATGDQPTADGSPVHVGRRPDRDATVVARLRAAGAVVLGKTVTTEFALFTPGPTGNPHDPARTPGGSSSGSAAAVAAGTVPLALGTQTAGSIVRPASFCGVVGAKPTFGLLPTDGVTACSPSLDTVGVLSRVVEDAVLALGVLAADPDRFAAAPAPAGPRLGFARTHEWRTLPSETRTRLEAAVEPLRARTTVVDVTLPPLFDGLVEAQKAVMGTEALRHLGPLRARHGDLLSPLLLAYLDEAERLTAGYGQALDLRDRCRAALPEVFDGLDAIVTPAVLGEAPTRETTGDPLLCRAWTLLGTPAVAVPGLRGPAGLPLGVQVVAAPGADGRALAAAAWLAATLGT